MKYTSENMNYIFNVSYFDDIDWAAFGSSKEENDSILKQHNDAIRDFSFKTASPVEKWRALQMKGYTDFQLCTQYPGLMIGTGNEHSLKMDGAIKCGFSFDYTTGLPYIPGSSLKGALRACFPGDGKKEEILRKPLHPYTQGLIQSFPSLYGKKEQLKSIPGTLPDLSQTYQGCIFAPRCRYASERCFKIRPQQYILEGDHKVACHKYGEKKDE